jgi:hypothetical protein
MHDLWCVGLQGIHNFHEKTDAGTILNSEIELLVRTCDVKNLVLLFDSDCLDVEYHEEKDLAKRPFNFYTAVKNFRELSKHLPCDVYFSHIQNKCQAKGLDDLLVLYKGNEREIIDALANLKSSAFFHTQNITDKSLHAIKEYFAITSAESFYSKYEDILTDKPFIYSGSKYQYVDDKLELVRIAEASQFIRVGDDYYERVQKPDGNLNLKPTLANRKKSTITDDYKKRAPNILEMIPKFKGFCNVPSHTAYKEFISTPNGDWYNLYLPIPHIPAPGEITQSLTFARHIFGDQLEIGLDYLQLLYLKPTQVLPILCLVSQENNTGKSTFLNWLKLLFGDNITTCGSQEFESQYNDDYITKSVVVIEEALIDKDKFKERIKAMSTAKTWKVNAKWASRVEVNIYLKFILLSNNEDNFVRIDSEDIRFWVRKVPVIVAENVYMMADLDAEAPAFLHFLRNRTMRYPEAISRMWFPKAALETEALKKVVEASKSTIEKGIDSILTELFMESREAELKMTAKVLFQKLQAEGYKSFQKNYLEDVLKKKYQLLPGRSLHYEYYEWKYMQDELTLVPVKDKGRYYTFNVANFLNQDLIQELGIVKSTGGFSGGALPDDPPF